MSGRASIQLTTARWRAPSIITSARNFSTSPWSFQGTADTRSSQDVDIIRRLRKHERSTAAALNADLDDFLDRFDRFYKPKPTVDEGVQTALRQNKYISTERLRHDETVATIGKDVVEQYEEFRKHLKDYEEEPYPEWQPGDSDVVTRQLSQSSRKLQDYEDEKKITAKDANRGLDKDEEHYQALLRTRDALREKGLGAAERVANDFINSNRSVYAHVSATLDPVDLDSISEDVQTYSSLKKKSSVKRS